METPPAATDTDRERGRLTDTWPGAPRWATENGYVTRLSICVNARVRPMGSNTSDRNASWIDWPVTTSMTRPATLKPALL